MKLNVYYGFNPVYFQHFFFSVAAIVDFTVSRISPSAPLQLLVDHFGPWHH